MKTYKEPMNEVDALATAQRLMRHYERIEAIIPDVQQEDNTEWEGDAVDELYQAQTILLRAATTLAHHFDLVLTVNPRVDPSAKVRNRTPAPSGEADYHDVEPANDDERVSTANRLVRHAEEITGIAAKVYRENQTEFDEDAVDQLFRAKETLLKAATNMTLGHDDLTIQVVKVAG